MELEKTQFSWKKWIFAEGLILFAYMVCTAVLQFSHEPWRDEGQAWLIARDAPDILTFFRLMGYEGTPALWHLILKGLNLIGLPYESMAVVHYFIIVSAVFIFLRFSKFPLLFKALMVFGYYFIFEYSVIARSYSLSVLLLFSIAALYQTRFEKPLLYAILIFLLANTNVHSMIIAMAILALSGYEAIFENKGRKISPLWLPLLIGSLGVVAAVLQLLPPSDLRPAISKFSEVRDKDGFAWSVVMRAATGAFITIPELKAGFWDTILAFDLVKYFGTLFFLASFLFFRRNIKVLSLYTLINAGLFSVFIVVHPGWGRHHGLILISFLFCLWLLLEDKTPQAVQSVKKDKRAKKNAVPAKPKTNIGLAAAKVYFGALFLCQIIAGMIAAYYEVNTEFSAGKAIARYLLTNDLVGEGILTASFSSFKNSAILPYIPKQYDRFYNTETRRFQSYTIWDKASLAGESSTAIEIMNKTEEAAALTNYRKVVLLVNKNILDVPEFTNRYQLLAGFGENDITRLERVYVYLRR